MNDWKHPNGITRDYIIAQRQRLRADLAAVRRTAELIAEAKRQDRERADALEDRRWQRQLDRRDKHEFKAAEYHLGDMTLNPDAWAWGLTSARAADTYLAVLQAGHRWDDGEALDQLETEILDRYGIDLHDLPTAIRTDVGPGDDEADDVHAQRNAVSGEEVDAPEPEPCSICDGDGWISSPAWLDWHNRSEAARRTWEAENPDPYDFWDQSNEAAALYFDQPNEPEEVECDDCDGTGQKPADAMESMSLALRSALEGDHNGAAEHYARARQASTDTGQGPAGGAVEDDIHALLDRTPRDTVSASQAAADAAGAEEPADMSNSSAKDDPRPMRKPSTTAGEPVDIEADDRSADTVAADGRQDEDGMGADGPVADPKVSARDEANDAPLATADVDQVGDDASSPVERAQRAVLELKGRRALEERYARDREDDDASRDRAFYKAAVDVDACGRPGPVLSAFDD